jgi:hypothetical protein
MNEFAETATQLADDDFVQSPAEMNVGLAAKRKARRVETAGLNQFSRGVSYEVRDW